MPQFAITHRQAPALRRDNVQNLYSIQIEPLSRTSWFARGRRVWFVFTAIPRYIWSGTVHMP